MAKLLNKANKDYIASLIPENVPDWKKVWQEGYDQEFSRESVAVSRNLQSVYEKIAKERQIEFLPAAAYVHCCEADQEHLNASGHKEFAEVVYQKIRKFL